MSEVPVIVSTSKQHSGGMVLFGFTPDPHAEPLVLNKARMVVYWSSDLMGFMGLAARGPSKECRIGPEVDIPSLRNITSVTLVSSEALKKWEQWK